MICHCPISTALRPPQTAKTWLLFSMVEFQLTLPTQLRGKQLWVSHGIGDTVIPIGRAQAIRKKLPVDLTHQMLPWGHEIRPAEWAAVLGWPTTLPSTKQIFTL